MAVAPPPQIIGSADAAQALGISTAVLRSRLRAADPIALTGYIGKISGLHCWNAHDLFARLFPPGTDLPALVRKIRHGHEAPGVICNSSDCEELVEFAGLCRRHLRRFMRTWQHADDSELVLAQFVAMCRWVVDRHEHLVLPAGFDPFASVCMTPDCGQPTNVNSNDPWWGPMCRDCTADFWNNSTDRPRPAWWTPTRAERERMTA